MQRCWRCRRASAFPLLAGLLSLLLLGGGPARAQDSLPVETLNAVKAATVFLKVEGPGASGRGTGFVIQVDGDSAYLATNHHVVSLGGRAPAAAAAVTAVFGSGSGDEQTGRAEVLAADPRLDIAVLRVRGLRKLPVPLDLSKEPKLVETMPVFIFGFPLGELLATGKGNPAITVGKGSVSSIRLDERRRLASVQINGDLTPGNSGGPVVDSAGRLIGVAVATVRDRQIGFAIPAAHLSRHLQGQLTDFHFTLRRAGAENYEASVDLGLFDPLGRMRQTHFYYLPGDRAAGKKLALLPGVTEVKLTRIPQSLTGKFPLALAPGSQSNVTFQVVYVNGEGKTFLSNPRVHHFRAQPDPAPVVGGPGGPARPAVPPVTPGKALDREALARALEDLQSGDNNRRREAANRLASARPGEGRAEVLKALDPLLGEKDLFVRTTCARAFVAWAGKDELPRIYEVLRTCGCYITRGILIEALPRLDGAKSAEAIAAWLPDLISRQPASKALQQIGPGAEKAVLPYLDHTDWGARMESCKILKVIGTASSLPALKKAAGDANPGVARAAQEAVEAVSRR